MRILIAETTWASMSAAKTLNDEGFLLTRANDGTELFEYADLSEQNVIVFDADLPDMEALGCLRRLRHRKPGVGIVLLVPAGDRATMLRAFEYGADDVVQHKADSRELVARIQAVARRRAGLSDSVVKVADLTLDCGARTAFVGKEPLHLTRLEYELMEMLALRMGQIVSKEEIMAQIYALGDAPDSKIIGVYVCHIRAKIAALGGDAGIIDNVRGRGYALVEPGPLEVAA